MKFTEKLKKAAAVVFAAAMAMSAAVGVNAAEGDEWKDGKTIADKLPISTELEAPEESDLSNGKKYTYTLVATTDGVDVDAAYSESVEFTAADFNATTPVVTKTAEYDLSKLTFYNPGDYNFDVMQSIDGAAAEKVGTVKLAVAYKDDVSDEVVFLGMGIYGTDGAKKLLFKDSLNAENKSLTVIKKVSGNQARRNYSYEFEAVINGEITKEAFDAIEAPAIVTRDYDTKKFSFKINPMLNPDGVELKNIPYGTKVQVSEVSVPNGYEVKYVVTVDGNQTANGNGAIADEVAIKGDTAVEITNTKNGVAPTGIILDIMPFALMVVLSGAAITFICISSRRRRNH